MRGAPSAPRSTPGSSSRSRTTRRELVLGEARVDRAGLDAGVAVDALLGIDVEHLDLVVVGLVRRRMDAVDGADFDAGVVLGADAGFSDHVSHGAESIGSGLPRDPLDRRHGTARLGRPAPLVARGEPVRCLVRDARRLGPDRMHVSAGDRRPADPAAFRNALRGVRTVVHLAGSGRDQPGATRRGARRARHVAAAARRRARPGGALRVDDAARRDAAPPLARAPHEGAGRPGRRGAADPDHDVRHLAALRARRPAPGADGAAGAAAGRAADRPRGGARAAAVGRGRGGRDPRRPRPPGPGVAGASSWPGPRSSPHREVVTIVAPRGRAPPPARPDPARGAARRPARRRDARRPDGLRHLGRGADARRSLARRRRPGRPRAPRRPPPAPGRGARRLERASASGGRWCAQGRAVSICAATWSSVSSPSGLPTICTLVGRSSSPKPTGTEMAGWPVTLNSDVKGVKRPERARSSIGCSPRPLQLADRAAAARPARA